MRGSTKTLTEVCESVHYGYTASASSDEVGPRFLRITNINSEDRLVQATLAEKIRHQIPGNFTFLLMTGSSFSAPSATGCWQSQNGWRRRSSKSSSARRKTKSPISRNGILISSLTARA